MEAKRLKRNVWIHLHLILNNTQYQRCVLYEVSGSLPVLPSSSSSFHYRPLSSSSFITFAFSVMLNRGIGASTSTNKPENAWKILFLTLSLPSHQPICMNTDHLVSFFQNMVNIIPIHIKTI